MKAIPFLVTSLINLGIGGVLFFFLLLALNGFSGKQAEPGLILFAVWVLLAALLAGAASVWLTNFFVVKKEMNFWLAAAISIIIFSLCGCVFNVVGWFASLFVTEALR